eukprot:6492773-Amphidinium_carterae.3
MDPYFEIDMHLIHYFVGEHGSARAKTMWKEKVFQCSPDAEEALTTLQSFVSSPLFAWTSQSLQGEIQGVHDMVARMRNSTPVLEGANDTTPWMKDIAVKLQCFIEVEVQPSKKVKTESAEQKEEESERTLVGVRALESLFQSLLKKESDDVKLEDLKVFSTWRHLLTETQETKIAELRNALMKTGIMEKPVVKAKAKPKSRAATKAVRSEQQLNATARALLGLKVHCASLACSPRRGKSGNECYCCDTHPYPATPFTTVEVHALSQGVVKLLGLQGCGCNVGFRCRLNGAVVNLEIASSASFIPMTIHIASA